MKKARILSSLIKDRIDNSSTVVRESVWDPEVLEEPSMRAKWYALLRVLMIIGTGVIRNKILTHAAALSYYSLISIGPLIAIAIMISGFVLDRQKDENVATEALNRLITFIAPSAKLTVPSDSAETEISGDTTASAIQSQLNPALVDFINRLVENARSGAVGLVGSLILILIVIKLFTSIEKTFNFIWGIKQGRRWVYRLVVYWTLFSLGAVLGFSSLTLLSASAFSQFFEQLPLRAHLVSFLSWLVPLFSAGMLVLLLTTFFRFIPNTYVHWWPAFIGALGVMVALFFNNYLSFLYINKVVQAQSLYGSVGIIFILMFGLYIFWLLILIGGQITYSVQNLSFLTTQRVWGKVSFNTKELIGLAALILICRRFENCQKPYSIQALEKTIRVPPHILNKSLMHLRNLGWISEVHAEKQDQKVYFQPARPLRAMTLQAFKRSFESCGNCFGIELVQDIDPVIAYYKEHYIAPPSDKEPTFDQLIESFPVTSKS